MQQITPFDIVVYHSNCFDGFGSAWVARMHSPNAVFIGAQHGDPPPDVAGKRVLICDFSYPRDVLLSMWRESAYVMVLDHHKTAEADLANLIDDLAEAPGDLGTFNLDIAFDMDRSGVGITWDTLRPRLPRPRLVDHIEDRDLWRFWIPGTREIHAALSCSPFDFDVWDEFAERLEADPDGVERDGAAVLKYTSTVCAKLAARAKSMFLTTPHDGGLDVWAVNAPPELLSETAEILKDREPHMPILAWSWDGERDSFYCSLRSRADGPDVSEIAKWFGGGGHEHAAGFRCADLRMIHVTPDGGPCIGYVVQVRS